MRQRCRDQGFAPVVDGFQKAIVKGAAEAGVGRPGRPTLPLALIAQFADREAQRCVGIALVRGREAAGDAQPPDLQAVAGRVCDHAQLIDVELAALRGPQSQTLHPVVELSIATDVLVPEPLQLPAVRSSTGVGIKVFSRAPVATGHRPQPVARRRNIHRQRANGPAKQGDLGQHPTPGVFGDRGCVQWQRAEQAEGVFEFTGDQRLSGCRGRSGLRLRQRRRQNGGQNRGQSRHQHQQKACTPYRSRGCPTQGGEARSGARAETVEAQQIKSSKAARRNGVRGRVIRCPDGWSRPTTP